MRPDPDLLAAAEIAYALLRAVTYEDKKEVVFDGEWYDSYLVMDKLRNAIRKAKEADHAP